MNVLMQIVLEFDDAPQTLLCFFLFVFFLSCRCCHFFLFSFLNFFFLVFSLIFVFVTRWKYYVVVVVVQ